MPQTTEQTRIKTVEQGLQQMTAALQIGRRDDGTVYRYISSEHAMYEDLIEVCRALHSGELPNDWRFEAIYDICHALLEYSEPDEKAWTANDFRQLDWQIAEQLVDVSYTSLFKWLSEHNGRQEWIDDDTCTFGCSGDNSLGAFAQLRQQEELNWMVVELIDQIESLVDK